jgi:CNT family concentrative nucleoside transporter
MIGLTTLLAIGWLLSEKRRSIQWALVFKGLLLQLILALLILKVPAFAEAFKWMSSAFVKVISFTNYGTDFLMSSFAPPEDLPEGEYTKGTTHWTLINFAFRILPTIIFFSALTALLYYLNVLQKFVYAFAWLMKRTLKLSGAESLAAAGNIFLGQTESPLLVRPYLGKMTRSELMCLMTGGMATIAGGVLASYIGFLGGADKAQQVLFAQHLLTASLMSAPAAVVAAKLLVPEVDDFNTEMKLDKTKMGDNVLEAVANGTTDGLKLAVNVGAMLLVFTAFIYFINYILGDWLGQATGLNDLIARHTPYNKFSMQFIVGYAFAPIAWLLGVPSADVLLVGQLLGEKTILNEFYAYVTMGQAKAAGAFTTQKALIMSTYMLCGFANFASIGIQIGGIGALVPERRGLLSSLGVKALIGGTLASLFTAVLVGMFM